MNQLLDLRGLSIIIFFLLNIFLFALMGIDKKKAQKRKWRISEKTLLLLGLFGGGAGGFAGMFFFRHKTRHSYFHFFFLIGTLIMGTTLYFLYR